MTTTPIKIFSEIIVFENNIPYLCGSPNKSLSMKRAIKINVETKTIETIILGDDYKEIYPAIGNGCSCFAIPVEFPNGDSMYVDDESLLRPDDIVGGFIMEGWRVPIIGNAILLGCDEEGESISCKSSCE